MRKSKAAVGTSLFFALAPGVVAGLVPWLLTDWEIHGTGGLSMLRLGGVFLIAAGAGALVGAFVRFVVEGLGTPAPVAPTQHLVVGGLYRYVRNPMYLAVVATILGQAILLAQWVLVVWAALVTAAVASFVLLYEEPTLSCRYGAEYDEYREAVPRWFHAAPRPWTKKEDPARS